MLDSIKNFFKRLAGRRAMKERERLTQEIRAFRKDQKPTEEDSLRILRDLRSSR